MLECAPMVPRDPTSVLGPKATGPVRCDDSVQVDPMYPPPPCISYALVQATVGVGTAIIVCVILITYEM